MTLPRIIEWPVEHQGPFDSDEVKPHLRKELLKWYPVLNHFVWGHSGDFIEGALVRTALLMATASEGHNTDTNLALRKLLEARDLHRHTRERLLNDNPH